jgi:hypothetical protein
MPLLVNHSSTAACSSNGKLRARWWSDDRAPVTGLSNPLGCSPWPDFSIMVKLGENGGVPAKALGNLEEDGVLTLLSPKKFEANDVAIEGSHRLKISTADRNLTQSSRAEASDGPLAQQSLQFNQSPPILGQPSPLTLICPRHL